MLSPSRTGRRWIRRRWLVLAGVLAVVLGPYAASRFSAAANRIQVISSVSAAGQHKPSDRQPVNSVTVAVYNVAHGRGTAAGNWTEGAAAKFDRIKKIAAKIKRLDPDIVALNEVDFDSTWSGHQNQAQAIAIAAGYPYRVEQRNLDFRFIYGSFRFGNAILSRYPLTDAQAIDFPAHRQWENWLVGCKRGAVVSVRVSDSQQIRVAAVHLEHRSEGTRVQGAKRILSLVGPNDQNPLIVAGDFNSTPTSFPQSRTNSAGQNAMDILIQSGAFAHQPTGQPEAHQLTFSTVDPRSVIDWILVSNKSASETSSPFLNYQVVDDPLSDHRMIVAEIKLD